MRRPRALIAFGLAVVGGAVPASGAIADLRLVSRSDSGANPGGTVSVSGVSGDGSRIAFTSADALAGPATGGVRQLYVRDIVSGRTLLASRTRAGQPANAAVDARSADTQGPSLSSDGRFAVFTSTASNLVAGDDDGGLRDVFRADLATGAVRLASTGDTGGLSTFAVDEGADMSGDGARIVYSRVGTAGGRELVVRDLLRGGEVIANVAGDGSSLPGPFGQASISADGRVVAFSSLGQIYVRYLDAGATVALGADAHPDLSGDGSVVVAVAGGVIRRTVVATGATASVATNGAEPRVSADGRRVAWTSLSDTVPGDTNGQPDTYVAFVGGAATRASERATAPVQVSRAATGPVLSADGGRLGFELDDGPSPSASLVTGDTDLSRDVIAGTMTPTDGIGPQIVAGVAAATTSGPTVTVSGRVTDPSGVVSVVVRGSRARVDSSGAFAVTLDLAAGTTAIPVRAVDGGGNASVVPVVVSRVLAQRLGILAAPRVTGLAVAKSGRRTLLRFRLDQRATRVWVRLYRRQAVVGGGFRFTGVGAARRLAGTPGARGGLLATAPLARGIYQARVTVVSARGTRVVAHRFVVRTAPPAPTKKTTKPR